MNFFNTPWQRKFLFASLYLSEGAPIGFIWLALPTRLRAQEIPVDKITELAALLVLPWTFKFAWAPLIDSLRGKHWTLRHWIVSAQLIMGVSLTPLLWINPAEQFSLLTIFLFIHAMAAATQDVAIDALCISTTDPGERGQYNGWMQAGMMIGRALMGGGALVMAKQIGEHAVVGILIFLTTFSMILLLMSRPPVSADEETAPSKLKTRLESFARMIQLAIQNPNTWLGLLFALLGGAAFKSMEVVLGPFLVDRGFTEDAIGWFTLGPMIVTMLIGALLGGWITDRIGARRCVAVSLIYIAFTLAALAFTDQLLGYDPQAESGSNWHLLLWLTAAALGIGSFTSASYALFMDITNPLIAATQFSAFMGATNGCESWSSLAAGKIITEYSYSTALLVMSGISVLGLPILAALKINLIIDPIQKQVQGPPATENPSPQDNFS